MRTWFFCLGCAASACTMDLPVGSEGDAQGPVAITSSSVEAGASSSSTSSWSSGLAPESSSGAAASSSEDSSSSTDDAPSCQGYFDLHVKPVLTSPSNLCVNCHTRAYGYPRHINFLEGDAGSTVYDSLRAYRSQAGGALYNVDAPARSRLLYPPHGFNGVAPAFPASEVDMVITWVECERAACLVTADCPEPAPMPEEGNAP